MNFIDPDGRTVKWWWFLGLVDPISSVSTALATASTLAGMAGTIAGVTYTTTVINSLFMLGKSSGNSGNPNIVRNMWRINNSLFVTNKNKSFGGRVWEFFFRFTWEVPQTSIGYYYTQGRNMIGRVDRVDYFDGATFAIRENAGGGDGMSLGNYINMNITGEITGDFQDWVLANPMFMHEYGHTFDSRAWGPLYLPVVGLPSLISAANQRNIDGEPGVTTHDFRIYEMRANRKAAKYFERYGVDWDAPLGRHTIETFYPRIKR